MPRGVSLHLGLNKLNVLHYGFEGKLQCCINDACAMMRIAKASGFRAKKLLNEKANSNTLDFEMRKIASELGPGDIFFLSFAGHGDYRQNKVMSDYEETGYDQAWLLYDRMVIDDELSFAW